MPVKIRKQRAIIDRKALIAALDAVAARGDAGQSAKRALVLSLFKDALAGGLAEVRRRFEYEGASGAETVAANAFLMDQLIRILYDHVTRHVFPLGVRTKGEDLSLVAVGGYGRGELAPFSDIDLLFLLPYKRTPHSEQVVEWMLYLLWDLGLKVGHATRSVDECLRQAKADITVRTALLESRWLWGGRRLANELKHRFLKEIADTTGMEFVEAKLNERDQRHERLGDSRYVLEPNVKEGKGGLRDLHTLFWIAKYLYGVSEMGELVDMGVLNKDAAGVFAKAQNFLWTVRCHLHYATGRAEDRLTFDVQPELGRRMNYTDHAGTQGVERFMKHYFLIAKQVGDLTRVLCAVLEERNKRKPKLRMPSLDFLRRNVEGFKVDSGRLNVLADGDFADDPVKLIRIFHAAQRTGLDIHPHALKLITQNLRRVNRLREDAEANRLFMEILTNPEKNPEITLRMMNEAGVLGRFIPDFGRVVAQMQYDMYHVYTVDEHTIRAIGILHDIEKGRLREDLPVASAVIGKVQSRRALYVGLLLHDIAKGRGGDHSELGAGIARKLGPRFGLTPEETETASWLVRFHLLMSNTAFKRDIEDPTAIEAFVREVQSPERLRLLLVLTCADIRAVGPGRWNGWKAALLRDLYSRAEEMISGGLSAESRDARVAAAQDALRAALSDWPPEAVEAHLSKGYPSYWLGFDTATHVRHARLIRATEEAGRGEQGITIETRAVPERAVTEVIIHAPDHPGLFSNIAGAISMNNASVVDAKIITLANGMALDTFWVQDASADVLSSPERLERLKETIEKTLSGAMRPDRELAARKARALPSRTGVFTVAPRVVIDNTASKTHTVIEVNGRDRPGFLQDVTAALTAAGLQIASAHISTFGERAVDVFYVKDVFGMKVHHEGKLRQVREALVQAIDDGGHTPPQTGRPRARALSPRPARRRSEAPRRAAGG